MMKEEKFFVYGTLMNTRRLKRIIGNEGEIISMYPAVCEGKLFKGDNFPVMLKRNEGRRARQPLLVYGCLLTLNITYNGIKMLDAYEGCSKARILKNSPSDLYHRTIMQVRRVYFKSLKDFVNMRIITDEKEENAWVYTGNLENDYIKSVCYKQKNRAGVAWKTFFNTFEHSNNSKTDFTFSS